jgi:hypothetical protein
LLGPVLISPREVLTHPHPVVLSIRVPTLNYKLVISIEETLQVDSTRSFKQTKRTPPRTAVIERGVFLFMGYLSSAPIGSSKGVDGTFSAF